MTEKTQTTEIPWDSRFLAAELETVTQHRSLWGDVWRQFRKHKGAIVGVIVFIFITLAVSLGPLIQGIDPSAINFSERNLGPTLAHPLGTDNIGHDTLAQMLAGGQVSLAVGFSAMLIALLLGTLIGVLAGFIKSLDGPLMCLTDLFLALPILPLLLVIILLFRDTLRTLYGPDAGIFMLIVFVIGITSWMHTARIVRSDVLGIKEREFVIAAHSIGTRKRRIIFRHILPNILSPIMVSATLGILYRDTPYSKFVEGGRKWFKSGDEKTQVKFEGDILNGVPNGQGTFTLPNGGKYVGEVKNGEFHGQGTFTWPDGGQFVGEWKDGIAWNFKTEGTVTDNNGWKLVGEYKDGKHWNWKTYNKEGTLIVEYVNGKQTLKSTKKQ